MALPIVTLATALPGGGAERIAAQLHRGYGARGHATSLVTGRAAPGSPEHLELRSVLGPTLRNALFRRADTLVTHGKPGIVAARALRSLASPRWMLDKLEGREEFDFPETHRLLELLPERPRLLHAHNLHGGWFDLRALPALSRAVPTFLTLHDLWLLTGHCAHGITCERWRTGCGACPDLAIYPAIGRDRTALNWKEKQAIYAASDLHVAAPAQWLLDRVQASMLGPHVKSLRLIPNGVDTAIFSPGDRALARTRLGLPQDVPVVAFAAADLKNPFKDPLTVRRAVERLGLAGRKVLALAIGSRGRDEALGAATWRPVPFVKEQATLATYFVAADVYCHAAKAELLGNTIIESMACARPVVVTAVGGMPERVRSLVDWSGGPGVAPEVATGLVVPPQDPGAMAAAIAHVLDDPALATRLGENARRWIEADFSLETQVSAYLDWFDAFVPDNGSATRGRGSGQSRR